jgi:CelD/BcsL family acetyltransferase involved in cellulose biosynthesis
MSKPYREAVRRATPKGIGLHAGNDAFELIRSDLFTGHWRELYNQCPWGTVCQSTEFCKHWYELYADRYSPLIITEYDEAGLSGLFLLATERSTNKVVAAGDYQAEYKVWLARAENANTFIERSLERLSAEFKAGRLQLLFLPPNTPLQWISSTKSLLSVRPVCAPYLEIGDGRKIRHSLSKSSNRSRLKRLGRDGGLQFLHITDPPTFERYFDKVMDLGRLRLAGIYGVDLKEENDPLRKEFHMRLLSTRRLLHATVLLQGTEIVSGHFGLYNRDHVLLGSLKHSPFHASHSPGKLHILLLSKMLLEEGVKGFDLTPGGSYKDRFATSFQTAHAMDIFFNLNEYRANKTKELLRSGIKRMLGNIGVSPELVKQNYQAGREILSNASPVTLHNLFSRSPLSNRSEFIPIRSEPVASESCVRKNSQDDLLLYRAGDGNFLSTQSFFRYVLRNLEQGADVYTCVRDNRLLMCLWVIKGSSKPGTVPMQLEADSTFIVPEKLTSVGVELYKNSINEAVRDLEQMGADQIYLSVPAKEREGNLYAKRCF